jgi:hypothetical protein
MDSVFSILLGVGIGIAVGTGASSTGAISDLRSGLGLVGVALAAAIAALVGLLLDESVALAAVGGLIGGTVAIAALGNFVQSARRRAEAKGASAGLALWLALFALLVIGASLLWPPLAILPLIALIWLAFSRRRREPRKYKGLRSLT